MRKLGYLKVYLFYLKINHILGNESFEQIILKFVDDAEKRTIKYYSTNELKKVEKKINKSLSKIELVSTISFVDAKCLHRALLQYILFRKYYCMPVKIVIGVIKFPFSSHVWIEWKGEERSLVCEYEENIVGYDVIFDSDEYIERLQL